MRVLAWAAASLILSAAWGLAQDASGAKVLSEQELKDMVPTWTDPASGTRYVYMASASAREQLQPQDLKKGAVPFRITAMVYAYAKGQRYPKREDGTAHLYLLDAAGKPVVGKDVSLAKMCPS